MDNVNTMDSSGILFVCHECDALQRVPDVEPGHDAICIRCKSRLFRNPRGGIDKPLALVITVIIMFIVANIHPIMDLTITGVKLSTTITGAAYVFWQSGSPELAAIVWLPSVLIPGLTIAGLFYVLFSIRFQLNWPYTKPILMWIGRLLPWGMMDVFLLGILVSMVKLAALASIIVGIGFYAFVLAVVLYAATLASLEPQTLWESLKDQSDKQNELKMPSAIVSARELGMAGCHTCGKAVHVGQHANVECPRCGADVHYRKHDSIMRAWAFLIAAMIMYIPANTEPMMRTTSLGNTSADTILEGVVYFVTHGDWPIGLVIFCASVMLPLFKMLAISYILISVQRGSASKKTEKTTLYNLAELLGKWSMLDIFVVGLMAGLIQLGKLTTIAPGPACIAFASVVILTMFAEMAFDPKLIWDQKEAQ